MGEMGNAYKLLVRTPEGKIHLEDLGVDGRIILKRVLEKYGGGIDWIHLTRGRDQWGSLKNTGSIKCGEFLD
jgi:hypothetical protein